MKFLLLMFASIFTLNFLVQPALVQAQGLSPDDKNRACAAFDESGDCEPSANDANFNDVWRSIINVATFVVGIVAVLLVLIGGLRYVISSGDPQGTAGAKNTIIYAIVGLVIAIAARSIILFVLDRV